MKQYLNLLQELLNSGNQKGDRTGTGTLSKFGHQMRFDLSEGFPLLTTKKMFTRGVIVELLWFLKGDTNIKYLNDNGVHFWDSWADENGDLGPIYGDQFRRLFWIPEKNPLREFTLRNTDQIRETIRNIRLFPDSRRHVITTWRPEDVSAEAISASENVAYGKMALAACHGTVIQFYVCDGRLSCATYQRSADALIGLPVNIASYALLTHMIAQQCDLGVGELIYLTGDTHLYLNHLEQAKEQLTREPFPLPKLQLKKATSIFDYKYEDFEIVGYETHPAIKAPVAV